MAIISRLTRGTSHCVLGVGTSTNITVPWESFMPIFYGAHPLMLLIGGVREGVIEMVWHLGMKPLFYRML